jgi:hypothetical protein
MEQARMMKSVFYERLFQLNRCLEQVAEILEQFRQDEIIHPIYARRRTRAVEDLRADLSHVLAGMLHLKELEACVPGIFSKPEAKPADDDRPSPDR